jgi:hypothetical protein
LSLCHPPLDPGGTSVEECLVEILVHVGKGVEFEDSFTTQFVGNDIATHGLKDIAHIVHRRVEYRGHFPFGLVATTREMEGHFGFDGILEFDERAGGEEELEGFFVEAGFEVGGYFYCGGVGQWEDR